MCRSSTCLGHTEGSPVGSLKIDVESVNFLTGTQARRLELTCLRVGSMERTVACFTERHRVPNTVERQLTIMNPS